MDFLTHEYFQGAFKWCLCFSQCEKTTLPGFFDLLETGYHNTEIARWNKYFQVASFYLTVSHLLLFSQSRFSFHRGKVHRVIDGSSIYSLKWQFWKHISFTTRRVGGQWKGGDNRGNKVKWRLWLSDAISLLRTVKRSLREQTGSRGLGDRLQCQMLGYSGLVFVIWRKRYVSFSPSLGQKVSAPNSWCITFFWLAQPKVSTRWKLCSVWQPTNTKPFIVPPLQKPAVLKINIDDLVKQTVQERGRTSNNSLCRYRQPGSVHTLEEWACCHSGSDL